MADQAGSAVTPAAAPAAAAAPATLPDTAISLDAIVGELFGGARTTYTLRDGTVVTFEQAKFRQIAKVTLLFQEMVNRIPKDKFRQFLEMVVEAQTEAMAQGKSQQEMSLNAVGLIEKAMGENSMLLTLFATVIDILPDFVPHFCDLSSEAFGALDLDEAVVCAAGVVAVNYGFFTRTLPPLLKGVIAGWQQGRLRGTGPSGSAGSTSTAPS